MTHQGRRSSGSGSGSRSRSRSLPAAWVMRRRGHGIAAGFAGLVPRHVRRLPRRGHKGHVELVQRRTRVLRHHPQTPPGSDVSRSACHLFPPLLPQRVNLRQSNLICSVLISLFLLSRMKPDFVKQQSTQHQFVVTKISPLPSLRSEISAPSPKRTLMKTTDW